MPVVLILDGINSYQRKSLIESRIGFVVPGKQIYFHKWVHWCLWNRCYILRFSTLWNLYVSLMWSSIELLRQGWPFFLQVNNCWHKGDKASVESSQVRDTPIFEARENLWRLTDADTTESIAALEVPPVRSNFAQKNATCRGSMLAIWIYWGYYYSESLKPYMWGSRLKFYGCWIACIWTFFINFADYSNAYLKMTSQIYIFISRRWRNSKSDIPPCCGGSP